MDDGVDTLIKWGQANGAVIDPSIKFKKSEDRGICAFSTKRIPGGSSTPQIKIPSDIIIKSELSDNFFGKETFKNSSNVNSGLKLLVAKLKFDNESTLVKKEDLKVKFAPFIDLLPVGKGTGSVFYWSSEELELLENTNLGGSLNAKLDAIIKEWHSTVKSLNGTPQLEKDLEFIKYYNTLSKDDFVSNILDVRSWTSFGAYLWSSVIFTSRAFPHDLIDKKCNPGQAILLPIIDLLNHENSSNVEWRYQGNVFSLLNLDSIEEGVEVFNNYGAKGNEELLMGYGFAVEKNQCDSIALKVKLPPSVVKASVDLYGFTIPRIEDYTQFAFTNDNKPSAEATDEDIEDGMLFFINYNNLVPDNLLLLFMFLARSSFETKPTLRSKLEALQTLRSALERKQGMLKKPIKVSESADYGIVQAAKIYRDGQKDIYKSSLAEIKHIEKQLLQEYKGHLTTLKKIYKKDERLQKLVEECFGLQSHEEIISEDVSDSVLFLWVILHSSLDFEESIAPDYITNSYRQKLADSHAEADLEPFKALASYLADQLEAHEIHRHISAKNLVIASEVLKENSYTRVSNDEIILVEPVDI